MAAVVNILEIGAYTCPAPIEYNVEYSDLDSANSGRGCTGYMTRERIRHGIAKISVKWTMLTNSEASNIINAVEDDSFTVKYNYCNIQKTATMYCSSQKVDCKFVPNDGDGIRWDIAFNLIEL